MNKYDAFVNALKPGDLFLYKGEVIEFVHWRMPRYNPHAAFPMIRKPRPAVIGMAHKGNPTKYKYPRAHIRPMP